MGSTVLEAPGQERPQPIHSAAARSRDGCRRDRWGPVSSKWNDPFQGSTRSVGASNPPCSCGREGGGFECWEEAALIPIQGVHEERAVHCIFYLPTLPHEFRFSVLPRAIRSVCMNVYFHCVIVPRKPPGPRAPSPPIMEPYSGPGKRQEEPESEGPAYFLSHSFIPPITSATLNHAIRSSDSEASPQRDARDAGACPAPGEAVSPGGTHPDASPPISI